MPIALSQTCKRLLEEAKKTPIEAIGECQSNYQRAETTHNQKVYETLAVAAAIVLKLRASPEDRATFDELPFWAGSRATIDDDRLPRRVLRFVLGAQTAKGPLYEQARSYANLVSALLDEGLSPEGIHERLSRSSVHKVMLLIARPTRRAESGAATPTGNSSRSAAKAQAGTADTLRSDVPTADDEAGNRDDGELAPAEREEERGSSSGRPIRAAQTEVNAGSDDGSDDTSERRPTFRANRDVTFDAEGFFDLILGVEEDDDVVITLRRKPSEKTWITLRAVNAQRVPRSRQPLL